MSSICRGDRTSGDLTSSVRVAFSVFYIMHFEVVNLQAVTRMSRFLAMMHVLPLLLYRGEESRLFFVAVWKKKV